VVLIEKSKTVVEEGRKAARGWNEFLRYGNRQEP
jgi:hypothetical protein